MRTASLRSASSSSRTRTRTRWVGVGSCFAVLSILPAGFGGEETFRRRYPHPGEATPECRRRAGRRSNGRPRDRVHCPVPWWRRRDRRCAEVGWDRCRCRDPKPAAAGTGGPRPPCRPRDCTAGWRDRPRSFRHSGIASLALRTRFCTTCAIWWASTSADQRAASASTVQMQFDPLAAKWAASRTTGSRSTTRFTGAPPREKVRSCWVSPRARCRCSLGVVEYLAEIVRQPAVAGRERDVARGSRPADC